MAVETATGRRVWDLRNQSDGPVRPAAADGAVYLNGKTLTARRITDGKELWTLKTRSPAWGTPEIWGPPTVYGTSVCAVHGRAMGRFRSSDGAKEWKEYRGFADNTGPVVLQGGGGWAIDGTEGSEVTTIAAKDGRPVFTFPLPEAGRRWIAADGNRVFVMNGNSLYALPVF
ncbi:PQQ-binding-like beta-propeller repeat protein [Streptomyces sp. MST-110588]|uniref:outer membrane protein assembly factor BamB family protein n=1 Tax=Streptomyces sp. MST-110588 TaxID=2833628 RepID=UPI003241EE19